MGPVNSLGELVQERPGLTTEKYKSRLVQRTARKLRVNCEILAIGFLDLGGGFKHSGSHPS